VARDHQPKEGRRDRWLGFGPDFAPCTGMKPSDLSHPLELLTAARDQVRVSLHLLSMDTRQKWTELEGKILSLENKLGQEAESISEATANAAIDLSGSVKEFVDTHVRHINQ
jgi:hypothetical protein